MKDENAVAEAEFLKNYSSEKYEKPSLTSDVVIFAFDGGKAYVLLVERGNHPYKGCYAFPGGFANKNEDIYKTAQRELLEETNIGNITLHDIGIFSAPGRDPRGWVVSYAYYAAVEKSDVSPRAGDDARETKWFLLDYSQNENGTYKVTLSADGVSIEFICGEKTEYKTENILAFDHGEMLKRAIKKARRDGNL